jgi:hypothetical protein
MGVDTRCSGSKTPQSIAAFFWPSWEPEARYRVVELAGNGTPQVAGEAMLARVLHELLIMSCMLAFVTGIVIAGARLLG